MIHLPNQVGFRLGSRSCQTRLQSNTCHNKKYSKITYVPNRSLIHWRDFTQLHVSMKVRLYLNPLGIRCTSSHLALLYSVQLLHCLSIVVEVIANLLIVSITGIVTVAAVPSA